ncbi:glutathione S-transferase C-terminal domain-containing protein [Frankia sp. CNm7]|uniref:Glutathione S-transferase C-terminal domain-containing protein n=1 Tax=Frankia nepalensis TaxID=1836974 RepID=A0A937RG68_9ACTN|nr:glutathione S-transferase C-terminal domain-containing protein [Frankia nepalensis]MBL7498635.1 glutathione S-transferase C-terminal domain-containing protein [Frankia nepalensis]MBL7509199.1 glutathione S-transferase C-terminal domain-containing protein [Frankia nepalensis]MBL7522737.1 glutathione S-transferase C-terminal domain-containing protein [Frankia nepalensis]MBL7628390.1 glutathione S-transferase C-terminal domain-containing protein [Frankia nepalensis]
MPQVTDVSQTTTPVYASPTDVQTYGAYTIRRDPGDTRPLYRFTGRITADGSSGHRAEPGRYHIYSGWFCPWAHRVTLQIALNGLEDVVSVSYVDNSRDARGWAFREANGPDPVNGFALLREAYEVTEPGFDGHVSVPTLWDRETGRVLSNDYVSMGIDLATQFGQWSTGAATYPEHLRAEIDELDVWIGPEVNRGVHRAAHDEEVRAALLDAFARLDGHLADARFLVGGQLTEADLRLWVSLVRYRGRAHDLDRLPPLSDYPNLWAYARRLYRLRAFQETTDFTTFTDPAAVLPGWRAAPVT